MLLISFYIIVLIYNAKMPSTTNNMAIEKSTRTVKMGI